MTERAEFLKAEDLAKLLKDRRDMKGIGLRAAAGEAGVSFNTFARVEQGHVPDIETFSRLARWLGRSPADFLGQGSITSDSTPDLIETHLRGDPALSSDAAGRIAGIVREFYDQLALLHGPEQIADLPVPVAESPGAVRIGHPERSHLVEYLAPNSVFNSLPRQRSSPHLRPDDRLVTIDRVLHHASLGVA